MTMATNTAPRSMAALTARRFMRHRMALASAVVLALLAAATAAAQFLGLVDLGVPFEPEERDDFAISSR